MVKTAAPAQRADLLALATVRLTELLDRDPSADGTLDAVMRRLFDRKNAGPLTVSAFNSSL